MVSLGVCPDRALSRTKVNALAKIVSGSVTVPATRIAGGA